MIQHAAEPGRKALSQLAGLRERHPWVGEVRGLGLLLGVELLRDHQNLEPANDEAERVMDAARRRVAACVCGDDGRTCRC